MSLTETELVERLKTVRVEDVPVFSLKGYSTLAKVVALYDGDTGDIVFPYNGTLLHVKARFVGYDTCEMKPSLSDPDRESKKKRALAAKQRLWHLCTACQDFTKDHQTLILVKCGEFDKYGRTLVTAFPMDAQSVITGLSEEEAFNFSINKQMINEGHAYAYDGGKKQSF